jgi:hypothetical protein
MHVDKSTLQTPFLTDYGPWFTNPTWYDGNTPSTDNMLNYSKIKSVYNSFAYSELDTNYILQDWDSLVTDIDAYTQNHLIPLVVMCLPFDRLDENAINNGWITTDGKYMYSTPGSPSPFAQGQFYGVSLAADILDSNILEVILPGELVFNETEKIINHVEIDFSDGSGWKTLFPNQTTTVSYPPNEDGFKSILYKIYFNDGTWVITHGGVTLKKKYDDDIPGTADIPAGNIWDNFTAETAFAGDFGKAKVTVAYGCGHTKLTKPLIIVPGIDPPELGDMGANIAFWSGVSGNGFQSSIGNETYESFLAYLSTAPSDLVNRIAQEGYDLVYIDYNHGADWIQRNGELTRSVIKEVNRIKAINGSTEPNVVLGISMGGVVSRYALATMEQNNENHDVKQWLSFDAPHNGAYFPESYQMFLSHIGNFEIGKRRRDRKPIREWVSLIDYSMKIFENPAPRQMLYHNWVSDITTKGLFDPNTGNGDDYEAFQAFMDNLGYPTQCEFFALSHGSEDMQVQDGTSGNMDMLDVNTSTAQGLAFLGIGTGLGGFLATLTGTNIQIDANLNGLPTQAQGVSRIYTGSLVYNPGLIRFKLTSDLTLDRLSRRGAMETAPGGNFDIDFNASTPGLTISNGVFCFMPTVSALALDPSLRDNLFYNVGANFDHNALAWSNTESPVKDFVSQTTFFTTRFNEFHGAITARDVGFISGQSVDIIPNLRLTDFDLNNQTFNFGASAMESTSEKIYPDLNGTNTRILRIRNGGVLSVNDDAPIGLNPNGNSNPISSSTFEVISGSANCNPIDIHVEDNGTLKIGNKSTDNRGMLVLTSGSRIRLMNNGTILVADNSTLIIEEGAVLEVSGANTINLEGQNSKIIVKGQINISGNSTFAFTKGNASSSGYLHLMVNEHNQGEVFTGSGSPTVDITGTNAFSDEVVRVEGGTLNVPANFTNFKITSGKINLVAGSTSSNKAQLDISSPIAMDYCLITSIGSGSYKPTGLITHGQNGINMPHLYMDNLDIGWYAKNNTYGNQPTIGYALIKRCVTGLVYEHIGVTSLANVNTHTCETGIELHNYASGTITNCNFTDISSTGLYIFNVTSSSQIHNLIDNNTFYNCFLGVDNVSTNSNTTTFKCTKFFFNAKAMKSANGLNMSSTAVYNGYVGGDNSIYECNSGIQLINNPSFTMADGQNNFYGLPSMSPYNFVYGSVAYSSINSTNSTIDVANNYWNPVPSSGSISSTGTSYCNLSSTGYFLGPHPTTFNLTPSGIILPLPNTTCFTVPTSGEQTGGYIPKQKADMVETFKTGILNVVPNPMENYSTLVIESSDESSYQITVLDAFGKVITDESYPCQEGVNAYRINLEGQRVGLYFVKIYAKNELLGVKKVIKINR